MVIVVALMIGMLSWIGTAAVRSMRDEREPKRTIMREFGLSFVLLAFFVASWVGQVIAEWQEYTDQQNDLGKGTAIGDFVAVFTSNTLQNWQSEFFQLFSFVTLSALYIHKGSAESKDSADEMEASLRRIEEALGTLPDSAPESAAEKWKLPETVLEMQDAAEARQRKKRTTAAKKRSG